MPIIGSDGLPIIGTKSAQEIFMEEKINLRPQDHDWVVLVEYGLTFDEAARAAAATPEAPADPPIRFHSWNMGNVLGPLCRRCQEPYEAVADQDCPGQSFEAYIASLDPDVRDRVMAELQRRLSETDPDDLDRQIAEEGYDTDTGGGFDGYTLPDGQVVERLTIPEFDTNVVRVGPASDINIQTTTATLQEDQ